MLYCSNNVLHRLCAFVLIAFLICHVNSKKAKYIINYSSKVTACDSEASDFMDTEDLRATRYNETISVLDGPFSLMKTLSSPTKLDIVMYKILPTGGTELTFTHEIVNLCDEIKKKNEDTMIGQYLRAINFPAECPVPADEYYITNMVADTNQIPIKAMMAGRYRLQYKFSGGEESQSIADGVAVPDADVPLKEFACILFDVSVDKVT